MMCPKCESPRISGPTYYTKNNVENLRYVCSNCGYIMYTPTKDALAINNFKAKKKKRS